MKSDRISIILLEIIPEPEWEHLLTELKRDRGTAFITGATDSGKSTLTRYLTDRLLSENIKVSLIDTDVGQSSLGLPGTISMKTFSNKNDLEDFIFDKMYFTGTVNPSTRIHEIIETAKSFSGICRLKSDVVIIDTSGLISGDAGRVLKTAKIKAVHPEHIVALQREKELEHILDLVRDMHIHRIMVSRMAKERSREERTRYRKKKFDEYFKEGGLTEFIASLDSMKFFYNGKPVHPRNGDFSKGTLIGLGNNDDTIALGVVTEINDDSITFRSPLHSLKKINKVVFGGIKV